MINMSQIDSQEMWIDSAKMFNIVFLIQEMHTTPESVKQKMGHVYSPQSALRILGIRQNNRIIDFQEMCTRRLPY